MTGVRIHIERVTHLGDLTTRETVTVHDDTPPPPPGPYGTQPATP